VALSKVSVHHLIFHLPLPESVMPAEVFNPNPIIFTPTKGIVRKSELLAQSLWIDEPVSFEDETGTPELIDTDEIFGKPFSSRPKLYTHF